MSYSGIFGLLDSTGYCFGTIMLYFFFVTARHFEFITRVTVVSASFTVLASDLLGEEQAGSGSGYGIVD